MKPQRIALLVGLAAIMAGGACDCVGCEDEVVPGTDTGVTTDGGPSDATASDLQGFDWIGTDLVGRDLFGFDLAVLDAGPRDLVGTDTIGMDLGTSDAAPIGLHITGMVPTAGYRGVDVIVTLYGSGIIAGAQVTFTHQDSTTASHVGGTEVITDGAVNAGGTAIQVLFPALNPITDRPPGPYKVTVTNPAGSPDPSVADAPMPYTVTVVPPPVVDDVTPTSAYSGSRLDNVLSDRAVTIAGSNFAPVPDVMWIDVNNPGHIYHAVDVNYLSETQVVATVPSESQAMPAGFYHLFLQNPDGQGAYWMISTTVYLDGGASFARRQRGLFEITTIPPPIITTIAPQRPQSTELTGEFHVVGTNFDPNDAVVELLIPVIDAEPNPCLLPKLTAPTTADSATDLFRNLAAAPACGIGQGSVVGVRVTNPDGQFALYYSMIVTPSSQGHLSSFCNYREFDRDTCPSITPGSPWTLQAGRARHDSALGFDDLASAYIYVVGGEGAGTGNAYLDSVEAASVTPYGLPGAFGYLMQTDPAGAGERTLNRLKTPRKNHQVVRVQNFVFAIGGTVDSGGPTVSATVERARILGLESMPGIAGVHYLDASGSLPPGSWYYRVAAVTAEGEGLPSRELIARTQAQGSVQVNFEAFPGAQFYMIYRSLASDGRAQSARLIAADPGVASGSFVHFVDTGIGELAPAPGRLTASGASTGGATLAVGLYGYRVAAHVPDGAGGMLWTHPGYQVAAEVETTQNSISLTWEAVPGADEYRLYRTAVGDERGLAHQLNTGAAISGLQFVDTGFAVDTSAPAVDAAAPLPRGSLTLFSTLPSTMNLNVPREGSEAFVLDVPEWDPPTPDQPGWRSFIYVVAGRNDTGLYEPTTERTEVALLPVSGSNIHSGDLLGWEYQLVSGTSNHLELYTGRAFFGLVTNAGSHSNPVPPDIVDPCAVPDRDGDGYRRIECGGTDCNDDDPTIHPDAPEICGDGIDQNCDGKDSTCLADGGGYDRTGTDLARPDTAGTDQWRPDAAGTDLRQPDGYVPPFDAGPCATPMMRDRDHDGYNSIACGGTDCNDNNANINPGIDELCYPAAGMCQNSVDENCDGIDTFCCGGFTAPPDPAEVLIDADEPVFVTVFYGSDGHTGSGETLIEDGSNNPLTWETSFVNRTGNLMGWTRNDVPTASYSAFLGIDGLLYYNYLFAMPGMAKNGSLGGNIARFPACPPGARSATNEACPLPEPANYDVEVDLFDSYQSTSKANLVPRAFFSVERAYSRMFVCGGYSSFSNSTQTGTVTASCEQAQQ